MFQLQSNIKTVKKPLIGTYTMMFQLNHHYWMLVGYQKAVEFINISGGGARNFKKCKHQMFVNKLFD